MPWLKSPSGWPVFADTADERDDLAGRGYVGIAEADVQAAIDAFLAVESSPPSTQLPGWALAADLATKQDKATLGADVAADATVRAAYGRPTSTDGTNGLPAPTGVGLEFVITATGLQDIRFNGTSL